jgi:hypothetical protein
MKILLFVFLCIHIIDSLELSKYFLFKNLINNNKLYFLWFIEKLSSCQTALGMQSGSIPDSSISASSSYDSNSVGPKASR